MKKRFVLFLVSAGLLAFLIWIALPFATSESIVSSHPVQTDKLAEKHIPNDLFFMQRAYPDAALDVDAYTQAIKSARYPVQSRNLDAFPGQWTVQGPGNLGARINTIAVHPTDENTIYVGFARGGVWKTTDYGQNWIPVFDDQPFLAIGDIAIDPYDPETVYVGTGDPNISGYPGIGDGVYKSTDGGQSWTQLGLAETYIVSKIIIDPTDSDVLFVSTMGLPFEPNNDRGLYKSIDGGQSWEQILFVSQQAGIIDMLIDPTDPQTLYAAGWDRIRNNFFSTVSGPGAKIYKTTDGGANWEMLSGGLPQQDIGRIGLAMSGSDPNVLFAEYVGTDSQLYGIYRSEDGGQTWESIPLDIPNVLAGFGWYFGKIRVNPQDDNHILILGVDLWETFDGGQNWQQAAPVWWTYEVHADKHDLVFGKPGDSYQYLLATDGGLYANYGVLDFEDIEDIPASQFYRVAYNPHTPESYYGGMQDNGSSGGTAWTINGWPRIFGGDGFQMAFHPNDPMVFFAETQNGGIYLTTDGGFNFEYVSETLQNEERKNWDMPYQISAHFPEILYAGTYKLYIGTLDVGTQSVVWDSISSDLTKGVLTEPRYHTISTLHESPRLPGLLYVGASDGRVNRTDNNGLSWEDISAGLPDRYVTDVKASPSFDDWVYVTHSGYKWGEYIPRVHRSKDRGVSWEDISGDLPDLAINDMYIHPMHNDSVIFVGTDGGVYGTVDAGSNWERVGGNMPMVPVYDLEMNPSENTLMAGTFARSIMTYPLDSLNLPVQEDTVSVVILGTQHRKLDLTVFPSPAAKEITVDFPGWSTEGICALTVYDLSGKPVLARTGRVAGHTAWVLDVSRLSSGHYIVQANMGSVAGHTRFLKIEQE